MNIDIYKSNINHKKYLSVPVRTDLTELKLTDSDFSEVCPFKSQHQIEQGQPMIGLDPDDIINQINENGYAIHGTTTVQKISIVK